MRGLIILISVIGITNAVKVPVAQTTDQGLGAIAQGSGIRVESYKGGKGGPEYNRLGTGYEGLGNLGISYAIIGDGKRYKNERECKNCRNQGESYGYRNLGQNYGKGEGYANPGYGGLGYGSIGEDYGKYESGNLGKYLPKDRYGNLPNKYGKEDNVYLSEGYGIGDYNNGYLGYGGHEGYRRLQGRGRLGLGWDHRTLFADSLQFPITPESYGIVGRGYYRSYDLQSGQQGF